MRSSLSSVCAAAMLCMAVACGGTSPTAPTPTPDPAPAPAPTPPPDPPPPSPSGPGRLEITIAPNPVPYAEPPAPGCGSLPHTWQYTQTLQNAGGATITISDRVNFFDGNESSRVTSLGIVIQPGGTFTVTPTTRWCSANNIEHTARTDWSGADALGNPIAVTGPNVRLLPK